MGGVWGEADEGACAGAVSIIGLALAVGAGFGSLTGWREAAGRGDKRDAGVADDVLTVSAASGSVARLAVAATMPGSRLNLLIA